MNRILIEFYRSFLNILFNKNNKSALKISTSCQVLKKGELIYFGDIVHPCIRYSKNKFLAYNWWMVYTPYYNNNPKIENPILCYGIDEGLRILLVIILPLDYWDQLFVILFLKNLGSNF